jgi:hypothetical protein
MQITTKYTTAINRLVEMSMADDHDPFSDLQWPEMVSREQDWMPRRLLTLYGTPQYALLTDEQIRHLTIWESVNFYSLNVHGIRELLTEVIARIHSREFEDVSEFFHHFVDEENEHMWFFAKFCRKYAGKIYPERKVPFTVKAGGLSAHYLVFLRIFIFEEIIDYYNTNIGKESSLPKIIQEINLLHHKDESRHIAFGRQILEALSEQLQGEQTEAELDTLRDYTKRFLQYGIAAFYNPQVYVDAELPDAYGLRDVLLSDPNRMEQHKVILGKTVGFLRRIDMLRESEAVSLGNA